MRHPDYTTDTRLTEYIQQAFANSARFFTIDVQRRQSCIMVILWYFDMTLSEYHIDSLVQDCSIPIATALEILQSCINKSTYGSQYIVSLVRIRV